MPHDNLPVQHHCWFVAAMSCDSLAGPWINQVECPATSVVLVNLCYSCIYTLLWFYCNYGPISIHMLRFGTKAKEMKYRNWATSLGNVIMLIASWMPKTWNLFLKAISFTDLGMWCSVYNVKDILFPPWLLKKGTFMQICNNVINSNTKMVIC